MKLFSIITVMFASSTFCMTNESVAEQSKSISFGGSQINVEGRNVTVSVEFPSSASDQNRIIHFVEYDGLKVIKHIPCEMTLEQGDSPLNKYRFTWKNKVSDSGRCKLDQLFPAFSAYVLSLNFRFNQPFYTGSVYAAGYDLNGEFEITTEIAGHKVFVTKERFSGWRCPKGREPDCGYSLMESWQP